MGMVGNYLSSLTKQLYLRACYLGICRRLNFIELSVIVKANMLWHLKLEFNLSQKALKQ